MQGTLQVAHTLPAGLVFPLVPFPFQTHESSPWGKTPPPERTGSCVALLYHSWVVWHEATLTNGVQTGPGAMALTLMPLGIIAGAKALVIVTMAPCRQEHSLKLLLLEL